jgi:hypothetical protein
LVAAYEVMVGVPAVRNLIREGKTRQLRNILVTHRSDGMQTLEWSLNELVTAGTVDYDAAIDASLYPRDIPKPSVASPVPASGPGAATREPMPMATASQVGAAAVPGVGKRTSLTMDGKATGSLRPQRRA